MSLRKWFTLKRFMPRLSKRQSRLAREVIIDGIIWPAIDELVDMAMEFVIRAAATRLTGAERKAWVIGEMKWRYGEVNMLVEDRADAILAAVTQLAYERLHEND